MLGACNECWAFLFAHVGSNLYFCENQLKIKPIEPMKLKHFELSEFDSPGSPGSGEEAMNRVFVIALDNARELYGRPMKINSGYRTKARNKQVGGAKNSAHLYGCAADIACTTDNLQDMMTALWSVGFRRFGIMNSALHVDCDPTKAWPAIWGYGNESTERYKEAVEIFKVLQVLGE